MTRLRPRDPISPGARVKDALSQLIEAVLGHPLLRVATVGLVVAAILAVGNAVAPNPLHEEIDIGIGLIALIDLGLVGLQLILTGYDLIAERVRRER